MSAFRKALASLKTDKRGVTALEYGLIAALVAGVLIGAVTNLGTALKTTFTTVENSINTANGNVGH